ncbi:cadherin-like domain-containing protein, partial [Oscillochloris sp. ZM17-4]|uniref:cadherin-like domain-containing protein n=1 Tax=Oscillochloris sp. ZM17-4 TaxID=2866714 RepID=UPI001C72BDB6
MDHPHTPRRRLFDAVNLRKPRAQIAIAAILILALLGVGTQIILADPIVTVTLTPSDPIVEGDTGSTVINYSVKLSQAVGSGQKIVIRMSTLPILGDPHPATEGTDYSATQTDLTFNPGETEKFFPVTIYGDVEDELQEGFIVRAHILSSTVSTIIPAVGANIDTFAVIIDDDNPTVDSISDPTAFENDGTIDFVVTLDKVSTLEDISIAYKTVNGTATSGTDFTGTTTGTLLISTNHISGTIQIPLIDDLVDESDETFTLELLPDSSTSVKKPFTDTTATGTIKDDNDPPTAVDDGYSTNEDTSLTVLAASGVLANDTDPELDPLTAVLGAGPTNGDLALSSDGSFVYTPTLNFNGNDSFTYWANDGQLNSTLAATVTLTVTAVNDAPSFTAGSDVTVDEDSG